MLREKNKYLNSLQHAFVFSFLIIFLFQLIFAVILVLNGNLSYAADPSASFLPGYVAGSGISGYITALYNYAIGIVGILAAVVMMYGGIIWTTAGGNQGKVTEAQNWIAAAVTGLILALASYTILYNINPVLKDNPEPKFGISAPSTVNMGGGQAIATIAATTDEIEEAAMDALIDRIMTDGPGGFSDGVGINNASLTNSLGNTLRPNMIEASNTLCEVAGGECAITSAVREPVNGRCAGHCAGEGIDMIETPSLATWLRNQGSGYVQIKDRGGSTYGGPTFCNYSTSICITEEVSNGIRTGLTPTGKQNRGYILDIKHIST